MGDLFQVLMICLVLSSLLLLPVLWQTRRDVRYGLMVFWASLLTIFSLVFFQVIPLLYYQCLLTLCAVLGLFVIRPRRSVVIGTLLSVPLLAIAVGTTSAMREVTALRQEYPVESVEDRLAYESRSQTGGQVSEAVAVLAELSSEAQRRLQMLEEVVRKPVLAKEIDDSKSRSRIRALKDLHNRSYSEFVVANGFGVGRMLLITRHQIEWNEPFRFLTSPVGDPIPFPDRPLQVDPPTAIQKPQAVSAEPSVAQPQTLAGLHDQSLGDFIDPKRFGSVIGWRKFDGFDPHAMVQMPGAALSDFADWQVSRLELVSLLKFDSPRVYLSEHLPRMEELRNAKTRSVDEFEQRALLQLGDGEDVVIDQQLNTIRMVGAVRAAKQCLDCHSVRRGELLGAFSYLLDRKQPIQPPKIERTPVL